MPPWIGLAAGLVAGAAAGWWVARRGAPELQTRIGSAVALFAAGIGIAWLGLFTAERALAFAGIAFSFGAITAAKYGSGILPVHAPRRPAAGPADDGEAVSEA
jgi:hypothetical protein